MNNDDIHVRKDVFEAEKDALLTAINDTRDMIDALDGHITRILTILSISFSLVTVIVPVVLAVYFRN